MLTKIKILGELSQMQQKLNPISQDKTKTIKVIVIQMKVPDISINKILNKNIIHNEQISA